MNFWRNGLLIILLLAPAAGVARGFDIIIVRSSDNDYFDETIETLISHVEREARFRVVDSNELDAFEIDPERERYYVALGLAAAQAVDRTAGDAPAFNAYLTHEQYRLLQPVAQQSVLLDQPLYRYLAFCKLLLDLDSVGMLGTGPVELGAAETRILEELDFSLNRYRVDPEHKLLPLLRRLLQQNDALLMLPQSEIYNRDTLKGVLLTSYRFRKPAISYSPAHVRAGALASIYSSPTDIGRHLALLINRRLQHPGAAAPDYEFARFYTIATNNRVARSLNLALPVEAELRSRLERAAP